MRYDQTLVSLRMLDTPVTLLHRLCDRPVPHDWELFVRLFTPLLRRWAVRFGVDESSVEDLLQELFVLLIRKLPEFRHDPSRSFRAWLWTVFRHTVLAWQNRQPPAGQVTEQFADLSSPDSIEEATEAEYRGYLLSRVLQIVQTDFPETTWQIFQQVAIAGRPAAEVAEELNV
ncbi:MAG: polymerase sigma factor, partial [Planctomycetaceae bacterium]|nr:polymerase sigma factor [Planctomycetaceae bacterium]